MNLSGTLTHEIDIFKGYPTADEARASKYEIYDGKQDYCVLAANPGYQIEVVDDRGVRMAIHVGRFS